MCRYAGADEAQVRNGQALAETSHVSSEFQPVLPQLTLTLQSGSVEFAGAATAPLRLDIERRRAHRINLLPYLVGSAGVAAVGVSTALSLQAAMASRSGDCSASRCSKALESANARERQAAFATVGFGLGAAALGIAGYLFVSDRLCKQKRRPRMLKAVPMIGKGGGAFRVEARF